MGRSPGKWIKSVIFGKKSSKSQTLKAKDGVKSTTDKGYVSRNTPSLPAEGSPVISQPVLVNTNRDEAFSESEYRTPSGLTAAAVTSATTQNIVGQVIEADVSRDPEKIREVQAATKVQSAFRGFLSRRAFRVLKGIIRLQAVIRGHLVRRQAVVTLYSLHGIVRLQAIIRGRIVRLSNVGVDVKTKCWQVNDVDDSPLATWREKISNSPFVSKLISASNVVKPLRIHYDQGEPNSVLLWLDRWTSSCFWKPSPQTKKSVSSKSRPRRITGNRDGELGKGKRNVHKTNIEHGPVSITTESERLKRNPRKVPISPADAVQESPQSELEKVKRSLRKVSSSTKEPSERADMENGKLDSNLQKVTTVSIGTSNPGADQLLEKPKNGVGMIPDNECVPQAPSKALSPESSNSATNIGTGAILPSEVLQKEENTPVLNEELVSKEEQGYEKTQRSSKRRASFGENVLLNAPKLPSYMAATESAKAKLRVVSPRFGSDSTEKSTVTRRHSLPSSMNGKLSSQSPRTQKLILASCKGGIKNDLSLSSSREGTEKSIQIAWRR